MKTKERSEEFQFTTAEAVSFVRNQKSGTNFCVRIRLDAPLAGNKDRAFISGCSSYLNISRSQARKLAAELLSPRWKSVVGGCAYHAMNIRLERMS